MYKTVRHGENSLQYTILPQTEEVICNSGLKGKGRDYSPSIHVRRSRKGYSLQCVLLVVLLTIIAVLVAAYSLCYITTRLNSQETRHNRLEVITSVPLTPTGREIMKSRKKELKMTPDVISTLESKQETSSLTTTTATSTLVPTMSIKKSITPPWTMPALRSWKSSTPSTTIPPIPTEDNEQIPLVGTPSGSIRLLDHFAWKPVDIIIKPTVTPEPMTVRNIFRQYSNILYNISSDKPAVNKFEDVLITTRSTTVRTPVTTELKSTTENSKMKDLEDTILSADDDDDFKKSLEVDEVFSLPTVTAEGALGSDSDEVTVSKAGENGWYGARWPFVDTSSYFQWTGYSPGDNLLLPLLVAALSSIALVLLLALAVKRRKRAHTATASIGLTADLQADDNTNLLTAENPEDAEE